MRRSIFFTVILMFYGVCLIVLGFLVHENRSTSNLLLTIGSWIFALDFSFLLFVYCDRREKRKAGRNE
jgi:hypothetical protein